MNQNTIIYIVVLSVVRDVKLPVVPHIDTEVFVRADDALSAAHALVRKYADRPTSKVDQYEMRSTLLSVEITNDDEDCAAHHFVEVMAVPLRMDITHLESDPLYQPR